MKIPRNSPCPCGSGRKYKHCCGKENRQARNITLEDAFIELPSNATIYYLDTCVWGNLVTNPARANAVSYFQSNNYIATLSSFTVFELFKAPQKYHDWDSLFFEMRHNILIPWYPAIEAEIKHYPQRWRMRWLPVSKLVNEDNHSLLTTLSKEPIFIKWQGELDQFADEHFMDLEQRKENFIPLHGEDYSVEDVPNFAWGNLIFYLKRHFPEFLKYFNKENSESKVKRLPAFYTSSVFIFFKYYLHKQKPVKSDVVDILLATGH